MDRLNGAIITDEDAHIKQSIADILLTQIGTRIQRRDYGSNIPKLLDNPITRTLMLQIAACAVIALNKWEPRIRINQFKPIYQDGKVIVNMKITRTDTKQNMNYDNLLLGGK
ncbi:GPW/gp25 family protein [Caviibacterium pharyngocola]|uniref:Baseplate assembly protein W n=1 Tax=Caviibacterium pharyngocola TaxID=28159 RepID=A0A2M8RTA2_9PAST|nr:GPW/gp25 family protein [Caviibacterium pharyngocola]PJG82126.1 baseplate assembly protein W [Caviibacterium pharyngocola]